MRLWTVQRVDFWERLMADGSIVADPALVAAAYDDLGWAWSNAYAWMTARTAERVPGRPHAGAMPLWAWQQWESAACARPDLRHGGHLPRGERGVRIGFAAEDALLSDFDLWHFALNYWYIGKSEKDYDAFDAEVTRRGLDPCAQRPLPDAELHARIEASWSRVFDLDRSDPFYGSDRQRRADKCVQATLWRIGLDAVTEVTEFTAR
jgi:hypothetical protein